jgi:hypothetical protein
MGRGGRYAVASGKPHLTGDSALKANSSSPVGRHSGTPVRKSIGGFTRRRRALFMGPPLDENRLQTFGGRVGGKRECFQRNGGKRPYAGD